MATTTPDGIRTPDAGDQYALVQDLGALADTTQIAFDRRANLYKGTSAQRTAFTTAPEGVHWQDTNGSKFEYVRQGGSWVQWAAPPTAQLPVLWSGTPTYLTDTQTLTLSGSVSSQPTGIIVAWSDYVVGTGAQDAGWEYVHVPKAHLTVPGTGVRAVMWYGSTMANKYMYVTNTSIAGLAANATGDNRGKVLRYVWGY